MAVTAKLDVRDLRSFDIVVCEPAQTMHQTSNRKITVKEKPCDDAFEFDLFNIGALRGDVCPLSKDSLKSSDIGTVILGKVNTTPTRCSMAENTLATSFPTLS